MPRVTADISVQITYFNVDKFPSKFFNHRKSFMQRISKCVCVRSLHNHFFLPSPFAVLLLCFHRVVLRYITSFPVIYRGK